MIDISRKSFLLLISISLSSLALAESSSSAREWLERMTTAMSQMSYQGSFVYVRGGAVESMRITHVTDESGVRERLYSVSGPHREVIRDQNGVRCVLHDSSAIVKDHNFASSYFPELPLSLIEGGDSGYKLEVGGKTRIAGHTARLVSVTPVDDFRYGYDFWLEEQSGLLLQWVLLDPSHKPLAKLMFTDLALGSAIRLEELESGEGAEDFVELKTFSSEKTLPIRSDPRWKPAKLPVGFQLTSHSHKAGAEGVYEHMVYSDGLASVSVYVEQEGTGPLLHPGISQLGTHNAYARRQGALQILVIGEVPAITVKSIANEVAISVASN